MCRRCSDPAAVAVPQFKVREEKTPGVVIDIHQCPDCGQLVLVDELGWKGSGITAHVTEAGIRKYLETGRL